MDTIIIKVIILFLTLILASKDPTEKPIPVPTVQVHYAAK